MRRFLVAILLFGFSSSVEARGGRTSQVFVNGTSGSSAVNNTFLGLIGDRGNSATEANLYCVASAAGTVRDLYLKSNVAPGAGNTYVATFFKGTGGGAGASTALTTTLSGASQTTNNDSTNEVSVSAGDTLTVKFTTTGTPGNANLRIATRFLSNNATESFYCGGGSGNTLSTAATEYISPVAQSKLTATEANAKTVFPTAGTIAALYIQLETAPGAGATRTFTAMLNGVAQTPTCSITGASARTCSDTSNSFAVVAGDLVDVKSTVASTPVASKVKTSLLFRATTNGEFVLANSSETTMTNTAATFCSIDSGSTSNVTTPETDTDVLTLVMTVKNGYCVVQTGPGAGTSWAFQFRQNAGNAGPACTISNPNATCNSSTTVVLSANDLIDWQITPSGTPTATPETCSVTAFTTPRRIW